MHGALWSPVAPTPVAAPRLLVGVPEVAALLGLDPAELATPAWVAALSGNRLLEGMTAYAASYGGHQFGHWAGQLGDGRAIGLGEVVHDGRRWELQLKGAGPTPYSRTADGRAVLRSSIRELLCSEAMHHLGVPTTRALALVATGDEVVRDMFYDGRPRAEPGAIVCRVAPSFIRFGNFELPASRSDHALLERLADFTIARDFPHLAAAPDARARWFTEVCERTATMVAHWMRVGFVHGVMNTDNMSILGLTIDYGPYGWIDDYDPLWTPNTTDAGGRRYRFGNQPHVAHWNLERLAEAVLPLFGGDEAPLAAGLRRYADVFNEEQGVMMAHKLGLVALGEDDEALAGELLRLLHTAEIDMTIFFRRLADVPLEAPTLAALGDAFYDAEKAAAAAPALEAWLARWAARAKLDDDPGRRARMYAASPRYVLRNYLAQEVIDAAEQGDAAPIAALLDVLRRPYDEQPAHARYAAKRPDWARDRPGCSMLSCSS